jgi:poly(hydroxyalkanoate) granule-associated protein
MWRQAEHQEKSMATRKRKPKQRVNEFTGQLENVFLAGLGAFANARKMGSETFDALVRDGRKFREEASKKTGELIDDVQSTVREMSGDAQSRAESLLDRVRDRSNLGKLQDVFDKRVADTMDRLNVPSKNDIDKINKKLNKILKMLDAKAETKPARKVAKTRRKTATVKAAAVRPAGGTEQKAA